MLKGQSRRGRIIKATIGAAALILVDAFWFNQGVIAAIVGICAFISLPFLLWRDRNDPDHHWDSCITVGIYLTAAICVFTLNHAFNSIARERAETLILAINRYHEDIGSYPSSLESLIPKYLDTVPGAKPIFIFGRFYYNNHEGSPSLFYIALPPFGRPTYLFRKNEWIYVD